MGGLTLTNAINKANDDKNIIFDVKDLNLW